MNQLTFEPIAGPVFLILMAAMLIALLMLRPNFVRLTRSQLSTLVLIRAGIVLLAILSLLRPGCIMQIEQPQTGVVQIFVDITRSMQLPHGPGGESRYEVLKAMIEKNRTAIDSLNESNIKLRWFAFDTQLTEFEVSNEGVKIPLEATGNETDIGTSLNAGVQLVRNQRLLAAIVASDGQQNAIDPQVGLNDTVRSLNDSQVPLFTIPFGQADQSSQLADLAIENLADQYSVRANNQMRVTATLTARGFAGSQVPVQLVIVDRNGVERIVDTQRISIVEGFEQRPIQLNYTPEQAGQFQLLVRVPPQPNESALANNELPSFLTVEDRGISVLYLYGNLLWEQKFLRAALGADSIISIDAFPIDHRTRRNWPLDISSLLTSKQYDVIVFGDVDSRAIYDAQLQVKNLDLLMEAISQGTGFLMLGGRHSFGPGLYQQTPLANYLPILMEDFEIQNLDEPTRMDLHITGPLRAKPLRSHFTTRLGQGVDGGDPWDEFPALDVANRFVGVKDTASVLLATESNEPLMVVTTVGGRVMVFAADSTWKWRLQYSSSLHARFWRQVILWLAGQDDLVGDDVWISMQQRRFQLGQDVTFQAGVTSPTGESVANAQMAAYLVLPDGTRTVLETQATADSFSGTIKRDQLSAAGLYSIEVIGSIGTQELGSAETRFVIFDNDREKAVTGANPELLSRLASQTQEWGGRVVHPDEFSELLSEIQNLAPDNKILIPQRWRLGETWQDGLAFLFLFVGLLTVEWFLRKSWSLV